MEELYQIIYEKAAIKDLNRIKKYCSSRYYKNTIQSIINALKIIKVFPKMSKTLYSIENRFGDYRRAIIKKYVIIYKIEYKQIRVLRIFNVRENYINNDMFMVKEYVSIYRCIS